MKPFSRRWLAIAAGYLVVFTAVDAATLAFQFAPGVTAWYPPAGISFALLLGFGPSLAPAVFAASLISSFFVYHLPQPPWALVGWAIWTSLWNAVGAVLLQRIQRNTLKLVSLRDLSAFVVVGLLLPVPLALVAVSTNTPAGLSSPADFLFELVRWWMGEVTGLLTVTPFLITHILPPLKAWAKPSTGSPAPAPWRWPDRRAMVESIVAIGLLVAVCWLSFGAGEALGLFLFYLAFLPLAWLAMRYGMQGATVGSLAASIGTSSAFQIFRHDPASLPQVQFTLLMLGVTGLYLGSVVRERRQTEATYRTLVDRTLQGLFIIGNSRIVFANQAAADIIGDTVKGLMALTPAEVVERVHPDDLPLALTTLGNGLQRSASVTHEFRIFDRTHAVRWIRMSATRVTYAGEEALQAAVIDITAIKEAEALSRRHAGQLTTINEVGRALAETLDLQEIFNRLSQAAQSLFPDMAGLIVALYDPKQKLITAAYAVKDGGSLDTSGLPPLPLQPPGHGTLSHVIHTGQPLVVDDLQAKLQGSPVVFRVGGDGPDARSALYVPLNAREEVIGLIQVQSYSLKRFTQDDADLLSLVGNTAAIAIQNARLFAENMQRLETITALYSNAQKLSLNLSSQRLAEDVARTCVEGYGAQVAWLGRAEPDGSLKILAHFPPDHTYPRGLSVRWDDAAEGQGPAGRAFRSGYPVVIDDILHDDSFAPWRESALASGFQSVATLPLISRDKPIGIVAAYSDQKSYFSPQRISFLQAYTHQVAAALENARLFEETEQHIRQLQTLHTVDRAINASVELGLTLNVVLKSVVEQQKVDAAAVLIANLITQRLEYAASAGLDHEAITRTPVRLGEGHAGRAALEQKAITLTVPDRTSPEFLRTRPLIGKNFVFYHAEPLVARGQIKGVLEVFGRTPLTPSRDWLSFMETIASQTATAIENNQLFNGLQRTNMDLILAYDATIQGWSRALDLRDRETEGHTQRVTEMTLRLAQALAVSDEELIHVRRGALLHDIGKMGVPDQILLKPGPLTDEEWVIMKMHPTYAYEMLSPIAYLQRALDIPYCHHEKWDGAGYPRGLKAEQIPLAARIFAVVDVWDALGSDRPYRLAWPPDTVREHIRSLSGTHFEPRMVEAFLDLLQK